MNGLVWPSAMLIVFRSKMSAGTNDAFGIGMPGKTFWATLIRPTSASTALSMSCQIGSFHDVSLSRPRLLFMDCLLWFRDSLRDFASDSFVSEAAIDVQFSLAAPFGTAGFEVIF